MTLTNAEQDAANATLKPLGDYVMNVGVHKPLVDYTQDEISGLVNTILTAYHEALKNYYQNDIPF